MTTVLLFYRFSAWMEVVGVSSSAPLQQVTRTECFSWDQAFVATFHTGLYIALVATFIMLLLLPHLIGQYFWWVTSVPFRSFWVGGVMYFIFSSLYIILPQVALGTFPYVGVDPGYLSCASQGFSANGFLAGLLGAGTRAVDQIPLMAGLMFASVLVSTLGVIVIEQITRKMRGLRAQLS